MTTLRDLVMLCSQPGLIEHAQRIEPRSYDELMRRLNADLDALIGIIESDAQDFADANENQISKELVRLLKARCYDASHETDHGGHVDVTVKSSDNRYSWLAEAKILGSNSYLDQGMDQLIDRYAKGTPGHNKAALLIYVKQDRCGEKLQAWRDYHELQTAKYEELKVSSCAGRPGLAFYSEFVHPRVGKGPPKYLVRHLAVSLYRAGVPVKAATATATAARSTKRAASKKVKKQAPAGGTGAAKAK